MLLLSLQLSAGTFETSVLYSSVPYEIDRLSGVNWFSNFIIDIVLIFLAHRPFNGFYII